MFDYGDFCVEDMYKEFKTYKKIKIVEQHIRNAYENDNPTKWYITFNSIPQHRAATSPTITRGAP